MTSPSFRDGILFNDGTITVSRLCPDGGTLHIPAGGTLAQLKASWAEAHPELGLPALDPESCPVFRVRTTAVPLTTGEAERWLASMQLYARSQRLDESHSTALEE